MRGETLVLVSGEKNLLFQILETHQEPFCVATGRSTVRLPLKLPPWAACPVHGDKGAVSTLSSASPEEEWAAAGASQKARLTGGQVALVTRDIKVDLPLPQSDKYLH